MSGSDSPSSRERIALVTGKLAESALRRIADQIANDPKLGQRFEPIVVVLNIQVAALMTSDWVARKLTLPEMPDGKPFDRVILTGYCRGDAQALTERLGVPVQLGPSNLHDLPAHLGGKRGVDEGYGEHSIEIIAEINHAARLPMATIRAMAEAYRADGADVIDIGCDPQADRPAWEGLAEVVTDLVMRGFRVSVDSFHAEEVEAAIAAGAELVLSVNGSNREHTTRWQDAAGKPIEVVAIPDTPSDLDSLDATVEHLVKHGVPFRIDPIIEPIGFGFTDSLVRYHAVRKRHPEAAMMMGIGNLSEMTEVDSAGINTLLIGVCQELGIGSVLTTQVINWARSSVKEIDIARRIMHHALKRGTPPKHIDPALVTLRDPRQRVMTEDEVRDIARQLTDANFRLFALPPDAPTPATSDRDAVGTLHAINRDMHAHSQDPFELFDLLDVKEPSHAFYLGYELAKAMTALTLGKNYEQDEPLSWGMLTRDEVSHYENRKRQNRDLE